MPVLQTPTAARWPVGESTRSSASEEARYSPSRDQNIQATARIHLRDPSVDRNSGTLDLVILDDRATPVGRSGVTVKNADSRQ